MFRILTAFLLICFSVAGAHAQAPQPQTERFAHDEIAGIAKRYEAWIKKAFKPDGKSAQSHRDAGYGVLSTGKAPVAAARFFARAVATDGQDADSWLGLARSLLAIPKDQLKGGRRYSTPANAAGAAYFAYQRAGSTDLQATALIVLSQAMQRRSQWRPAIEALKTSLKLRDDAKVAADLERLQLKHGFRIVDYRVENESKSPRVCINFSETIAPKQDNLAGFVSVDGRDPGDVKVEGKRLCVSGLEHGQRYEFRVRAGLKAKIGEALLKTAELSIYVRDRSARVRFSGRNYVLPRSGQAGIPVISINTDKVAFEIARIGDRGLVSTVTDGDWLDQLNAWQAREVSQDKGKTVFRGTLDVRRKRNEEVTTAIPVTEAVKKLEPGVYMISARPAGPKDDENRATQWFVVSDLGLTTITGADGVNVFVRSLATALPVKNVTLRLIARNNEVLGTATTDGSGHARFDAGLARGEAGLAPAVVVAQSKDGDYGFLNMTTAAFDLTDRGVTGRVPPGPIDGFAYTDRGIYRPGETVHASALLRKRSGEASKLPATLIVRRPDGVIDRRIPIADAGEGGRTANVKLSSGAMTGTWRLAVHLDPKAEPVAETAVLVEDFVPERMTMDLAAKTKSLRVGTLGRIGVDGRYLYGPPAAKLALEGDIVVRAAQHDKAHPGYVFGVSHKTIAPVRETLEISQKTDEKGHADLDIKLPKLPRTARPLSARLAIRLREDGGRTIERTLDLPVETAIARIGIKPAFEGKMIDEGRQAGFEIISLDADGKRTAQANLTWSLVRLERVWQWYKRDGRWSYDSATVPRTIASGTIATKVDTSVKVAAPVTWGRYRLEVRSAADSGAPMVSSFDFNAGWANAENSDSPEVLDVALSKSVFAAGETAKIKVSTKLGGRALITVVNNGILFKTNVTVPNGDSEIPLKVDATWGAGAYVTVILHRPMDTASKRMPTRAIGMAWLALDPSARTIDVSVGGPETMRSGRKVTVPVTLANMREGESAYVTVAAVDLGILNLTRFKAPDPAKHLFAQTRLGAEFRDLYNRLIDGMRAERGTMRSGAGADPGLDLSNAKPSRENVALFSGIVKVGADGTAQVTFDMPAFNGTVRLMAVAWSGKRVGHAKRDMIVRDPVAITTSLPRFLTLGDKAETTVDLHNVEGTAGKYTLTIQADAENSPVQNLANETVTLAAGERRALKVALAPQAIGVTTLTITVKGPNGVSVTRERRLDVKPPGGDGKQTIIASLAKGEERKISLADFKTFIASDTRISVDVGPLAAFDVPGLLNALDRYPYGCTEQTVSRALPLLSFNALSATVGLAKDEALKKRISDAIVRVLARQDSSGAFGVWGPSQTDMWLTSYVVDFLTRAREAGYTVDPARFRLAVDRLANSVAYTQDVSKGGSTLAYSLYVLARNGRVAAGELRYYADAKLEEFTSPIAKAQIATALAMIGDDKRAKKVFAAALAGINPKRDLVSRVDFGSNLRDAAAVLALGVEAKIAGFDREKLARTIASMMDQRRYWSTQEQAWLLLAAKAMADAGKDVRLTSGAMEHAGPMRKSVVLASLRKSPLAITNVGAEDTGLAISVIGPLLKPLPAQADAGLVVKRDYYTLDGKPVDLKSANGGTSTVKQNDRFVVVLSISTDRRSGRILLEDRLPAGFEIENPRIVSSGDISALDWLKVEVPTSHAAFRDDRFVAAFNLFANRNALSAGNTFRVAYIVRAVTPGTFVHPAASVEDMYRPERHGRTGAGRVTITSGS